MDSPTLKELLIDIHLENTMPGKGISKKRNSCIRQILEELQGLCGGTYCNEEYTQKSFKDLRKSYNIEN